MKAFTRFRIASAFVLVFCAASPFLFAQGSRQTIYFYEDPKPTPTQWCAVAGKTAWNAALEQTETLNYGALIYTDRRLKEIVWTQDYESGDGKIIDTYSLDPTGKPVRLSRRINVLPGDRSILQRFSIREGKATKTGETFQQLSTGKPVSGAKFALMPKVAVLTRKKTFPFSGLLSTNPPKIAGRTCVPNSGDN